MKFVHTADWQVGMKAEGLGPAAARVRAERLAAGRRVVEAAVTHGADFLIVAGDLFEDNGVERILIQKTADILARFDGPVYIIPGNHDPVIPGSVWEHPAWNSANNLHILTEKQPVDIPGGILYPCPVSDKYSTKDPTDWIKAKPGNVKRIAMAHGNVEGLPEVAADHPIPRNAVERSGLTYLALGHWHSTVTYTDPDGGVRKAYCGTPEPSRFGEPDSGNALLVTIDSPVTPPGTEVLKTGGLSWQMIEKDMRQIGDIATLRQRVEALADPDRILIDLRLKGLLYSKEMGQLRHLQDMVTARFLFGRVDISGLRPSPDDDGWISALPSGVLQDAAVRLRNVADEGDGTSRQSQIASLALMELYVMTAEALK
jgi:DNA repair exonuclease SbcCD nuclease subunit